MQLNTRSNSLLYFHGNTLISLISLQQVLKHIGLTRTCKKDSKDLNAPQCYIMHTWPVLFTANNPFFIAVKFSKNC